MGREGGEGEEGEKDMDGWMVGLHIHIHPYICTYVHIHNVNTYINTHIQPYALIDCLKVEKQDESLLYFYCIK